MKTIEEWLKEYSEDHRNRTNQMLHKVCVPAIVFSLLGLFFSIPFPLEAEGLHRIYMNWASLVSLLAMIFYMQVVPRLLPVLMFAVFVILGALYYWEMQSPHTLFPVNAGIFVLAWMGQFLGHKIEGRKPSFFKDLPFLLIGPIWVFASRFEKL